MTEFSGEFFGWNNPLTCNRPQGERQLNAIIVLSFKKSLTTPLLPAVLLFKSILGLLAWKCDLSIPFHGFLLSDTQQDFQTNSRPTIMHRGRCGSIVLSRGRGRAFCSCLVLKACRVTAAQTPWRSSRGKWKTTVSGPHKCSMSHRKEPRTCRTH